MSEEPLTRGPGRPKLSDGQKADAKVVEEAEFRAIIAESPDGLRRWLDSQELTTEDFREVVWCKLSQAWRSRGVWEAAQLWIKQQRRALVQVWGVTSHPPVAGRIARAFAEVKFANEAPLPLRQVGDAKELDILPDTLRWVYLHPGLCADSGAVSTAAVELYEEKNQAPDQGARSRLRHCQSDEQAREKFFAQIDRILLEEKKRLAKKPDGGVGERQSDDPDLCDLEAEILRMQAKPA